MVRIRILFVLALMLLAGGCARNLVTRRHEFKIVSEKTEIEIGKKAKEDIVREYGTLNDLEWSIYIDQVGQKIASASDRPNLRYDFTILDTELLNAFAVPGGFVFVTRGLLLLCADEAELAAVLGHEITHIAAWHGIEALQRALGLQVLQVLGAIGGGIVAGGEGAVAIAQAAGVYANLYLLGYGREHELEADRFGIRYVARAGYDPEAMLTFLQRLDELEQKEENVNIHPYWRTHPPTRQRVKLAKKLISQMDLKGHPLAYHREKYQDMVARLPRGESAEKGKVEGLRYVNHVYGVTLEVPEGWKLDNSRIRSLVGFVNSNAEARGELRRYRFYQETPVEEFAKQLQRQWGLQEISSRTADYPSGRALVWQYGDSGTRYRTLIVTHQQEGYALICQARPEKFLQYLVDFEKAMRSFRFVDREAPAR